MSSRGANVTVTIGAAFAGSFKSVFREADRELKNFGRGAARSMGTADKAAAGMGKRLSGMGKAARAAGDAIGATTRELHTMRAGATHTAHAAREMKTLTAESRAATKAAKAHTAAVVRGARAQARARRSVQPGALPPGGALTSTRRTRSGVPAVRGGGLPASPWGSPSPRQSRGGGRRSPGAFASYDFGGGGARGGRRGSGARHGAGGHGLHSHDAGAIGGAVAGAFSAHTIWDAVKGAGEINDLQVLLKLQGRTTSEIAEATARAYKIAKDNPAISSREALQAIIDTADVGDRDLLKAGRLAPFLARSAKAVALIADDETKGKLGEGQSRALGRVIEDLGYGTRSEGQIRELVDSVTAGVISTRGIYNPKELLQTVQKSGGMARGWSKEFIGQVLPAVTMALGGSGSGDALYMYQKALTKGQAGLGSAKALMTLGLLNSRDLQYDGNKFMGIRPDSMPEPELLRKNPYEHFRKYIVPAAMRKAGITDVRAERERFNAAHANDRDVIGLSDDDKRTKLADKFRVHLDDMLQSQVDYFAKAKNQAKMIADFIAQQEQIDISIEQMKRQPKNALDILMGENFGAQVEAVTKSFHTLMSALGASEVGTAISAMDGLSKGMASLAAAASADPGTTQKVMAAFAAITAGLATAGTLALSSTVLGALVAGGPFTLAIGVVAAGLAAWAALDWDGFTEGMSVLMNAAKMIGSIISYLDGLASDGDGNNLIGRAVSAMLGNRPEDHDEVTRTRKAEALDAARKRLAGFDPKARGAFPGQKVGLEDDVARAEADLKATDDRIIAFEARRQKRAAAAAKQAKALSDVDQAAKDLADRQNAAKALQDHTAHADAASQEALDRFKPKAQLADISHKRKRRRPGQSEYIAADENGKAAPGIKGPPMWTGQGSETFRKGGVPVSAENVVITGPIPGAQGAPVVPGAALAQAGGKQVVEMAGPVAIKDDVGVKQPLRLVIPVLVSAQGVLNVHDSELQGTMSSLSGMLSTIAGHTASLPGILAACQAIAAKDFAPKITVQGGGGTGSPGAARERSSFSD